ncbi:bile acid:sodium symporter [Paracoccus sp. 11-3]|uniref:Bile acid:sodium symporter n=1 Tax=Paracoccus amoyensis TaxID=2760093 RepID=A0A926GE08_9RHOB|nr:bile acid:sodium symporter family protein [Paracoccus amoyensis]MBC9246796.1 bile acid:sodium symporter [Paracoccus amoyensis]
MKFLRRFGIDTYMFLLIGVVALGVILPAQGIGAKILGQITFWAVALLFFLYGAKLDTASVRAGFMNLRLQSLSFLATYVMFPVLGLLIAWTMGDQLGPELTLGILFLSVLPSTIQSSIAFTAMAGGNVPAAICSASLSNLVAVVLTPTLMALILHQSGGISTDAISKIALQILLPFVLGQLLRRWIGGFILRHKFLTMIVDRGSILLIVYSAFSAGTVAGIWSAIPLNRLLLLGAVICVFLAISMWLMVLTGRFFNLPAPDRTTLLFCGSTKSLASGLPIATAIFPASQVGAIILPLMLFHMIQLLVCAVIAQRKAAQNVAALT